MREKTSADRVTAFTDAVFAVIVTIMVLELKAPDQPVFGALASVADGYQLCLTRRSRAFVTEYGVLPRSDFTRLPFKQRSISTPLE